ncbi:hypothetical protein HYW59_01955 [Candidatus Kaiserbacteria bacterium]|nr:hypothetical protein [Candidatus Kaiserbacteria bacterium]
MERIVGRAAALLRAHSPALFAALVAALIVSGPVIAFPFVAGEEYRGINIPRYGDDEHYYMTRMKEALEGYSLGQPFLREGKDAENAIFSFVEPAFSLPLRLIGVADLVNAAHLTNVLNFFGVFTLALLIYAFTLRLTGDRFVSVGASLFVLLGYSIIEAKTLFFSGPNVYGRSFFPYASSVPFFVFLIALYEAVVRRRPYAWLVAGVLAGLLMYVYFYAWTFAYAILLALGLLYLVLREWQTLMYVCGVGTVGAVIGAYNLYELLQFLTAPASSTVAYFQAHIAGRTPVMSKIGTATALLALLDTYLRGRERTTYFVWALIAAGWLALNQQLLTGRIVQYGHFYWYFIVPLSIVIGSYFFTRIAPVRFHRYFAVALIVLALIAGFGQQYRSFHAQYAAKLAEQRYIPLLEALNKEEPAVVLTGSGGEADLFLTTIYTSHDLYWIPAAGIYVYPEGRLKEALELHLFLTEGARRNPIGYLARELGTSTASMNENVYLYTALEGLLSGYDFYGYERALKAGETSFGGLRKRLLKEIESDYRSRFADQESVRALLAERGVQYVLWDRTKYPEWDLSVFSSLEELVSNDGLTLYRL